jgi:acyl carrier protein
MVIDRKEFLGRVEEALRAAPGTFQETDAIQGLAGWDSIGALSIIALVDEYYGVTLNATELMECQTLADLAALVEKGR